MLESGAREVFLVLVLGFRCFCSDGKDVPIFHVAL